MYVKITDDDRAQIEFLGDCVTRKTPVTIYVSNGFQMRGVIARFDKRCLILDDSGKEKMVYHSAISTIEPHYPPRPHHVDAPWGGDTP